MNKQVITRIGGAIKNDVRSDPRRRGPNVEFIREELKNILPQYAIITDCVAGEVAIKAAGTKYLPQPNPDDNSLENAARYESYKERAVFYNVTKRTAAGLQGVVFTREPMIDVPPALDIVVKDTNGAGVDLVQTAKKATNYTLWYGRAGLFTDYPTTGVGASIAEIENGNIRPTITVIKPQDVVNWRVISRGGKVLLSLVVIRETYEMIDDGFEQKLGIRYRTLSLDENGLYRVQIWKKAGTWGVVETHEPTDANGKRLQEIPFTFIGISDNSSSVDTPPLYDIASLNIAHYRNSADYEESCYMVGQPTAVFAGLTEQWVDKVLGGRITLGSRASVALPVGGEASLLQAAPNSMPKEAMDMKERQMIALGAKLVEEKTVERTATEANIDNKSELSILSSVAQNVAAAITFSLEWCAVFVGIGEDNIDFELNTEFDLTSMSSEDRRQLIAEWQSNAITFSELRNNLRRAGIASEDDEKAKEDISNDISILMLGLNEKTQTNTAKTNTSKKKAVDNAV